MSTSSFTIDRKVLLASERSCRSKWSFHSAVPSLLHILSRSNTIFLSSVGFTSKLTDMGVQLICTSQKAVKYYRRPQPSATHPRSTRSTQILGGDQGDRWSQELG